MRYVVVKRLATFLLCVMSLASSTGCVTVPLAPSSRDATAKHFKVPARSSRVYCYRKYKYFACAITLPLIVDGQHVVDLAPNTYAYFDLAPGVHTFATSGPHVAPYSMSLNIQQDKLYFFRQDPRLGYWQNRFFLVATGDAVAKRDLDRCRLVQYFNEPTGVRPPAIVGTGYGTGFAVSRNGHILTAYHVVEQCSRIRVLFGNGEWHDAKLIKHSRTFDVALLKISAETAVHLTLCDSDSVRQGQKVFSIGYPVPSVLGKEPKYTEGVISSVSGFQDDASLLQVTVPIQPGNSGGALVGKNGEVVGMITSSAAIMSFFAVTGTLPQNVNWAVNADYFRPFLGDLESISKAESETQPMTTAEEVVSFVRGATCLVEVQTNSGD